MQNNPQNTTSFGYPFGMLLPERTWTSDSVGYRYGFNGMERVDEISGNGNHNTTEWRELDTRLGGRWWSPDPIVKPWESPYAGFANNPILWKDPSGLDPEKDSPGGDNDDVWQSKNPDGTYTGEAEDPFLLEEVRISGSKAPEQNDNCTPSEDYRSTNTPSTTLAPDILMAPYTPPATTSLFSYIQPRGWPVVGKALRAGDYLENGQYGMALAYTTGGFVELYLLVEMAATRPALSLPASAPLRVLTWGNNAKGHLIKHADALGFSGYSPQQLQKMIPQLESAANQLYNNINPALTRIGQWGGQADDVMMYITNNGKMLVTKQNGEFITVINKTSNNWYQLAKPFK